MPTVRPGETTDVGEIRLQATTIAAPFHGEPIPMSPSRWSAYRPSPSAPWDLARAWTLRRRAGFAATWDELQRDLDDGPEAAVDRVLAGSAPHSGHARGIRHDGRPAGRRGRQRSRHPAGSRRGGSTGCSSRPTR